MSIITNEMRIIRLIEIQRRFSGILVILIYNPCSLVHLNQESDNASMKQIRLASIVPAWNIQVDRGSMDYGNKDSEEIDMDKNLKDNILSNSGRVFSQSLWKNNW